MASIFRKKEEDVPEVPEIKVDGENGEIVYPETVIQTRKIAQDKVGLGEWGAFGLPFYMLTKQRLVMEARKLAESFPNFRLFTEEPDWFGFQGHIKVKGRIYEVVIESKESVYPNSKPSVYISPAVGGHHWHVGPRPYPQLCVERDWNPAVNTFADTVLMAGKFIHEFT